MKVTVIGGGPGGLYFSILLKKALPESQIDVFERNRANDAFGFGVVFSDETLSEFLSRDPESYELIRRQFAYWDELDVARDGEVVHITGNGFCGCSRKTLLQLLHQRCREVGVNLHFEESVEDLSRFKNSDVIVACDGIASGIRSRFENDFGTKIKLHKNRFVWLGSTKPLDAFTYFFRTTENGTFVAHTYQYENGMSTWIFETTEETWKKSGFEVGNEADTMEKLAKIFEQELDGHPLISNKSHWRQFPHVTNETWHSGNIVLLGDAKATAHFSIGSGTKMAMECAIALADSLIENQTDIPAAFAEYEKKRRGKVAAIQNAATVSSEWFEGMDRHAQHPFMQFAFGVMTRAKKVTFENLALRDTSFTAKVLTEFNQNQGMSDLKTPAAFTPFSLRKMTMQNRIMMTSMGQYSAIDGLINDWHFVHYGSRAVGGVGLIVAEMTAISPTGRITEGCAGIWNDEQTNAWKRVVDFVHQNSQTKIGIQLGHAGRKGSVHKPWEGGYAPIEKGWELISASAIPYYEKMPAPKEMTLEDMELTASQFVQASRNADRSGFDLIELQAHHGFLLATFLSPLTNKRKDEFGGNITNRLKFPIRVFKEMRAVFSPNKPMSVRISATDWAEGGITETEAIEVAKAFKEAGADVINVSTAGTVVNQKYTIGRMWQTPFSDQIRNTVQIPTITTGNIESIDQINTLLLNGRADLVAIGKPMLLDPGFIRNAQAYEQLHSNDFTKLDVPKPYRLGIPTLYGFQKSERKAADGMKKALKPASHKPKK